MLNKPTTLPLLLTLICAISCNESYLLNNASADPYAFPVLDQQMRMDPKMAEALYRNQLYPQQRAQMPNYNKHVRDMYEPGVDMQHAQTQHARPQFMRNNIPDNITAAVNMPNAQAANVADLMNVKADNINVPFNKIKKIDNTNMPFEQIPNFQSLNNEYVQAPKNVTAVVADIVVPKVDASKAAAMNIDKMITEANVPMKVQKLANIAQNATVVPIVDTNTIVQPNKQAIKVVSDINAVPPVIVAPVDNTKVDINKDKSVIIDAKLAKPITVADNVVKIDNTQLKPVDAQVNPNIVQKIEAAKPTVVSADEPAKLILDQKKMELTVPAAKIDTIAKQEIDKIISSAKAEDVLIDANGRPFLKPAKIDADNVNTAKFDETDQVTNFSTKMGSKNNNKIYSHDTYNSVNMTRSRQMDFNNESSMIAAFMEDLRRRQMMYYYYGGRGY